MDNDELKLLAERLTRPATIVFGLTVLLIVTTNLVSVIWWSPDTFQRLGSLWVAILVLGFGFTRLILHGIKATLAEPSELGLLTFSGSRWRALRRVGPSQQSVKMLQELDQRIQMQRLLLFAENRLLLRVFSSELIWLAIATLQWGYGDKAHCWINGVGWNKC